MNALEQPPKSSGRKLPQMNLADRVYLARYIDFDGPSKMGCLFGRNRKHIATVVGTMKKTGEFDLYRNLSDEEYEKILAAEERGKGHAVQASRM